MSDSNMACSFTASVLCICAAASYLVFRVIAIVSNRLYIARAHFFGGCSVLCWCFGVAQMQSKKFLVFSFFLFLFGGQRYLASGWESLVFNRRRASFGRMFYYS
uniref:Putative carrier protein n=1 Tax=Ixodes ricinus TaxID=34613 RepID=A0A0K8RCY1_IXORI